ncbi:hypothetical protein ABK040_011334 [Willaertia magna]
MERLTRDAIFHLFDFLIIPPKDFISIFLINNYWKEMTHDSFLFWERQLSNLFYFVYKSNLLNNNNNNYKINNIDNFYIYFFYNCGNLCNLLQLNFRNFFKKRKIIKKQFIKIVKEKQNIYEIKNIFSKLYKYIFRKNLLNLHKNNVGFNTTSLQTLQYLDFNLITYYHKMINILSEKSNLNTTQNYKFILEDIYNNYYYYNKLTTFEFNNLLDLYFTKLILNKDKQLFLKTIRFYNCKPLIVFIILLYLENFEKFNFIENYIFKVLQNLFSFPKKIQIYNLIFTILLENYNFITKHLIIKFLYFLKKYSNLGDKLIFKNYKNCKNYTGIPFSEKLITSLQNLLLKFEDKKEGFIILDFLFNTFKFSNKFIVNYLEQYNNEKDYIKTFKIILNSNSLKSEDLYFEFFQFNNFKYFKKGLYYLFLLIKKENNSFKNKYLKCINNYLSITHILPKEETPLKVPILKLNELKNQFLNYDKIYNKNYFKLFKRELFKDFIAQYFEIKSPLVFPLLEFFIKEWDFNFFNFVTKKEVDFNYLKLVIINTDLKKELVNKKYINLKTKFTITFYDLQFTLLELLSFYYNGEYCNELDKFNERVKYLLDNKLFDFYKKIIIADLDDGNCKDYIYKEYLKEDNLKIVWIEITTFELIERIRKVYNLN